MLDQRDMTLFDALHAFFPRSTSTAASSMVASTDDVYVRSGDQPERGS
jgi:hypothetical protein